MAKRGRPPKQLDVDQLEKLAAMHCTDREIAAFFDVSVDTIHRNYAEVVAKGKEKGKIKLRRAMWQQATERNHAVMMIFLAKNLLGFSDRVDQSVSSNVSVTASHDAKEVAKWLAEMQSEKLSKG